MDHDLAGYLELKKVEQAKDSGIVDVVVDESRQLRHYLTLGELRRVAEENRRLRAENAQMREAIKAAAKFLQPAWDAAIAYLVPLWQALEPLVDPGPHHGDLDSCKVCNGVIEYVEESAGNSDAVLNSWWSHVVHPDDGHDAEPGGKPLRQQLLDGIREAERGETKDLGDFSHYLAENETPLKAGDRSTCRFPLLSIDDSGADPHPCGHAIELSRCGRDVLAWQHVDPTIDGLHTAVFSGLT